MVAHNEPGLRVWEPTEHPQAVKRAIELRRKGYSYPDIADELGVSLSTAWRYVRVTLDRLAQERDQEADRLLDLELDRLDTMIKAVSEKAELGSLDHMEMYLKLIDKRVKLLGLDAPKRIKHEVEDKRGLPDVEVYNRIRALHQRLRDAGFAEHPMLREKSPFEGVAEGQLVDENAVKAVARPTNPATSNAENPAVDLNGQESTQKGEESPGQATGGDEK